ncbi:hypothetical protein KKG77_03895 [bacterium]|nr:hypothetical protein [bacterium]
MKKLFYLFLPLLLSAQMLQVGDFTKPIELVSQHEKKILLLKDGVWVIAWDKESTRLANKYFEAFGMRSDTQMLVDISQVPSGILNLFVLPRMRDYKHEILLSYDEAYNLTLPYAEGAVTVLHLRDAKVEQIDFAQTQEELRTLLQ